MEVNKAQADKLKHLISEWSIHPEQELEATIGFKGNVSLTSFMDIIRRLRSRGYEPLPQEDRINIILPNTIRFTLSGLGDIQEYCTNDTIVGRPYTAIIKDRTGVEGTVDFAEYDVRVKARRELPMATDDARLGPILKTWETQKKAFRIIRRWSFRGEGVRFDLSSVRSTFRDKKGSYNFVQSFKEQPILQSAPKYEVEVELVRDEIQNNEDALKKLIKGIGDVLRGLQRNTVLIRKSMKESVLQSYMALTKQDKFPRFRGVNPVTLLRENMTVAVDKKMPNIRTGYNVTDKADGLRVHGYCNETGELFLIDIGMNVYRTGLRVEKLKNSLVDAEWVTQDRNKNALNQLLLFDIYYDRESKPVDKLPFRDAAGQGRYAHLSEWVATWNKDEGPEVVASGVLLANRLTVALKTFLFGAVGDTSIFSAAASILTAKQVYHTDGLIFTSNAAPLPNKPGEKFVQQLKWKPYTDNTIDFLVNYEKDVENPTRDKIIDGFEPETDSVMRYKILRLYVGSSDDPAYGDPRATILMEQPFGARVVQNKPSVRAEYKPKLFNPVEYPDTMANICYGKVEYDADSGVEYVLTEDNEPIHDKSVVEMRYDPAREPGWRWIPMRIRHDKTERLHRGIYNRTLNAEGTANSVWDSIHDPITESMIRTGKEVPDASEISALLESRSESLGKKYYDSKASKSDLLRIDGLRTFHNQWIKNATLLSPTLRGGEKKLLDLSCGKAGDLHKWITSDVGFVFGVDIAGDNIRNPGNGAYRRYMDEIVRRGAENVPHMVFAIADSSKPLVTGEAGATPEEEDILRAVFGKFPPEKAVPSYIDRVVGGSLRTGADVVSCMFAMHYFFENSEKLTGLLQNIADTLKIGGYFVACATDGDKMFDFLADIPMGGKKYGKDGDTTLWTITKKYSEVELLETDEALGMAVDIDFISIGTTHTEYLVPFKLLVRKMRAIGLELLSDEEARALGLVQSTNLFEVSYKMAEKNGFRYVMSDAVKQFSFLNRWYIFKRRDQLGAVLDENMEATIREAAEAAAASAAAVQTKEEQAAAVAAAASLPKTIADVKAKQKAQRRAAVLEVVPEEVLASATAAAASPEVRITKRKTAARAVAVENEENVASAAASAFGRATAAPTAEEEEEGAASAAAVPKARGAREYSAAEIFSFYVGAPKITEARKDILSIMKTDPYAHSRLATIATFMVQDTEEDGSITSYPSIEHYMAAMQVKRCARKKANGEKAARRIFSAQGAIHQKFIGERMARAITEDKHDLYQNSLKDELAAIQQAMRPAELAKAGVELTSPEDCTRVMHEALREGLRQRLERDALFRTIVQKAREKGKYLLNFDIKGGDMTGRRGSDGKIKGNNRVGTVLMELAGIPY